VRVFEVFWWQTKARRETNLVLQFFYYIKTSNTASGSFLEINQEAKQTPLQPERM